jgi:hypothetical protein
VYWRVPCSLCRGTYHSSLSQIFAFAGNMQTLDHDPSFPVPMYFDFITASFCALSCFFCFFFIISLLFCVLTMLFRAVGDDFLFSNQSIYVPSNFHHTLSTVSICCLIIFRMQKMWSEEKYTVCQVSQSIWWEGILCPGDGEGTMCFQFIRSNL